MTEYGKERLEQGLPVRCSESHEEVTIQIEANGDVRLTDGRWSYRIPVELKKDIAAALLLERLPGE